MEGNEGNELDLMICGLNHVRGGQRRSAETNSF